MTISAPATFNQFANIPPLNRSANDVVTDSGVRISTPLYIDLPMTTRKDILNRVRQLAMEPVEAKQQPNSLSGISVSSYSTKESAICFFLGMDISNLRNTLFSRGGLEASLLLKLQSICGVQYVTEKEICSAFDARKKLVKEFIKNHTFNPAPFAVQ